MSDDENVREPSQRIEVQTGCVFLDPYTGKRVVINGPVKYWAAPCVGDDAQANGVKLKWANELRFRAVNAEADGKKTFSVEPGKLLDLLTDHMNIFEQHEETIAAQSEIIGKVKYAHALLMQCWNSIPAEERAYYGNPLTTEQFKKIRELHSEVAMLEALITKQPEPKEGV